MRADAERNEQKALLRATVLARRDAIPAEERIERSLAIAAHGIEHLAVEPGEVVSGFWPIRSEVDVRPLMGELREIGARLCLPAILDRQTIVFRDLVRGAPLVDMGFGTLGPGEEAEILEPALMLVPMAAFDARGHRIGYGAGYYDRAIARLAACGRRPRLVGVAFDCQEVDAVPDEPHDVVLDEILTESGLRRFGREDGPRNRHLVFAFGTLKRGFPLHEAGLADATFLGEARTVHHYPMLVAGPWFAPMMLTQEGTGMRVQGELYKVDDAGLARLDALESVGQPGNLRVPIAVERIKSRETCEALAFMKSPALAQPAHTGYLEDYQDGRFVPPWLRDKS